jgi:Ca2+/Na+ antiporter
VRPTAVLIAIVFGSAAAISFGLIGTSVIFFVLKTDHPQFSRELPTLFVSCLWFVALTGVAGTALYSTLKGLRWKTIAQASTMLTIAAVVWAYWP